MPELPDVLLYREHLTRLLAGRTIEAVRVPGASVMQTWNPPINAITGKRVTGIGRIGKRLVWEMEDDLFLVIHLMIAGRFHLRKPGSAVPRKNTLAVFDIAADDDRGAARLLLTEASTKKRATMHLVTGREALKAFEPGGIDVRSASITDFAERLRRENHTLKRSLTDPRLFDGIGNAYSDEILHRAKFSPLLLTRRITDVQISALQDATRAVLDEWIERLRRDAGDRFPEKVTAFRPEMAVHGRFGKPCPVCGAPVQRIVYAGNECNYCAVCQTGGRLLADRAWSRLLRADWPKTLEDLEELMREKSTAFEQKSTAPEPTPPASRRRR